MRYYGPIPEYEAEQLVEYMLNDDSLRDSLIRFLTHDIDSVHLGHELEIIAENNEYFRDEDRRGNRF